MWIVSMVCWFVIKTKTQKIEPVLLEKTVDPSQISFSLDEETIRRIRSNPDPETAFSCEGQIDDELR